MKKKIITCLLVIFFFLTLLNFNTAKAQITGTPTPIPVGNVFPIDWETNYAKLTSSGFFIKIGSKYFYGQNSPSIKSDPGLTETSIESIWNENGVQMRLFIFITKDSNNVW